jgi:hypothetical protein
MVGPAGLEPATKQSSVASAAANPASMAGARNQGMNVTCNPSDRFVPAPPAGMSRNQYW